MPERNFQQSPSKFADQNVEHLDRPAEVVIIKRVRNYVIPGSAQSESEWETFRTDFNEFLNKVLTPNKSMDDKWWDPNKPLSYLDTAKDSSTGQVGGYLYRHWQVVASAPTKTGDKSQVTDITPGISNQDVFQVNASLNTEGRGQCQIILSNREGKYLFKKNPFRMNQPVFESNDMVFVNLPDMDGKLRRTFTGLITSVTPSTTATGDGLQTWLTLTCEDMMKPLTQTRTATRPSGWVLENRGNMFTGLANVFADMLPHDIAAFICTRAYADLFTSEDYYGIVADIRKSEGTTQQEQIDAVHADKKETDRRLALPRASQGLASSRWGFTQTEGQATLRVVEAAGGKAKPTSSVITLPKRIFGFRRVRHGEQEGDKLDPVVSALMPYSPFMEADPDDLSFVIEGTSQPAYQFSLGGPMAIYASEWKSGLSVITEITRNINYEFFADELGIVRFRPLNVSLPFDFTPDEPKRLTKNLSGTERVGSEYWLKDQYIKDESFPHTDNDIFTIAYAFGQYHVGAVVPETIKGAAIDVYKYLRLGARTAPKITKMGIIDDYMAAMYARAYLSRLNANARSGTITYIGDSSIQVGNPVYLEKNKQIYYLSAITHTYQVGTGYTMSLQLKYGRNPLGTSSGSLSTFALPDAEGNLVAPKSHFDGVTDPSIQDMLHRRDIKAVLLEMDKVDKGNSIIEKLQPGAKTEADYVRQNVDDLTFQGFVWEPMYTLQYEDLYEGIAVASMCKTNKEVQESVTTESGQAREVEVEAVEALDRLAEGVVLQ